MDTVPKRLFVFTDQLLTVAVCRMVILFRKTRSVFQVLGAGTLMAVLYMAAIQIYFVDGLATVFSMAVNSFALLIGAFALIELCIVFVDRKKV